jgi:hypothetical protein
MAVRKSITEIIAEAGSLSKKQDKINFLREWDNPALRIVLKYTYDSSVKFLIPDTAPPWTPNEFEDEAKSLLYREARRLRIFVEGGGYDNLNQMKREQLFISLLEDVDNDDAHTLTQMISKKSFKGLTKKAIMEAYPDLIEEGN